MRLFARAALAAVTVAAGIGMAATPAQAAPATAACSPSAAHPYPVVLLHGTMDDATAWNVLAPRLTAAGYCVFAPTYGAGSGFLPYGGVAPTERSAAEVVAFIDNVLATTGATRVDIVGHSQGGTIAEYYAKNLGHASKVRTELLLSPTTHGTDLLGLVGLVSGAPAVRDAIDTAVLPTFCAACADQEVGSNFIRALNSGPIAQPNIRYAVLATRDDTTSTPAGAASFIEEPGVTNQFVQELSPGAVTHKAMSSDPVVTQWILDQLE